MVFAIVNAISLNAGMMEKTAFVHLDARLSFNLTIFVKTLATLLVVVMIIQIAIVPLVAVLNSCKILCVIQRAIIQTVGMIMANATVLRGATMI